MENIDGANQSGDACSTRVFFIVEMKECMVGSKCCQFVASTVDGIPQTVHLSNV